MFEHLRTDADRLAADAAWLRRERNAHARRSYRTLRRLLGSPPGLMACFSAGVFAGARSRRVQQSRDDPADHRPPERDRPERGFTERFLHGPLGAAAIRLGTAFIAGALMKPEHADPGSASPDAFT